MVEMKTSLIATALAAAIVAGTAAVSGMALAHDTGTPHAHGHINKRPHSHPNARVITREVRVSCYRGPLAVTAWDHPTATFIEDLIGIGYDYTQAWAMGMRICKDSGGVRNPQSLREALTNAIAQNPPDHIPVRQK
jgi:hypothetical protein